MPWRPSTVTCGIGSVPIPGASTMGPPAVTATACSPGSSGRAVLKVEQPQAATAARRRTRNMARLVAEIVGLGKRDDVMLRAMAHDLAPDPDALLAAAMA